MKVVARVLALKGGKEMRRSSCEQGCQKPFESLS